MLFDFCLHDLLTGEGTELAPWSRKQAAAAGREKQKTCPCELRMSVSIVRGRRKKLDNSKICPAFFDVPAMRRREKRDTKPALTDIYYRGEGVLIGGTK